MPFGGPGDVRPAPFPLDGSVEGLMLLTLWELLGEKNDSVGPGTHFFPPAQWQVLPDVGSNSSFSVFVRIAFAGCGCVEHVFSMLIFETRQCSRQSLQQGTADAEIKIPSAENPELSEFLPLKPGVADQNIAMHASHTARNSSLSNFYSPNPFSIIFFQILS